MKKILFLGAILLCIHSIQAQNKTFKVDSKTSIISYSANHMLHAWEGVNNQVLGLAITNSDASEIEKLAVLVKVRDFDSQNSSRDAHSLEVLEGIKFPDVKLYATHLNLNEKEGVIYGDLTFHGVKRPVQINAQIEKKEGNIHLTGSFSVKPSDFNIELPSFMMVAIDDLLELKFDVQLKTE